MCRLRNERYKTYQTVAWVMPQGLDLLVPWGVGKSKKKIPKFNQIWCVTYLYQWHMQWHNFLGPHPLGPWRGAKRSNIIKSQSQSQFQRFVSQTLCVFSQMNDIKHIRRDFHCIAWVMTQGWDLGVQWGVGGQKNFFPQIRGGGGGGGGGVKKTFFPKFKVNFKDFLTKLCVSSHK